MKLKETDLWLLCFAGGAIHQYFRSDPQTFS